MTSPRNTTPRLQSEPGLATMMEPLLSQFPIVTATLRPFLAGELNPYARMMCLWGSLAFIGTYTEKLWGFFKAYFTSTVYIRCTDEAYEMVLSWMSNRQLDHSTRSSLARVRTKMRPDGFEEAVDAAKKLHFSPYNSDFIFRHRSNFFSYKTSVQDRGFHKEELISITCLGRSANTLQTFLSECREDYLAMLKDKTSIFQHRSSHWMRETALNSRPISTVILNQVEKDAFVNDVETFLDPKTQAWYSSRSIPYRRGYLFHGPPGTGKTSLSLSVAGHFGLDMYYVNISNVSDQTLRGLFAELPRRCIVLLEDIDAAWTTQNRTTEGPEVVDDVDDMMMMMRPPSSQKSITLSGLLNIIDGVASQEGRILIMTTNHIQKLDKALIRPGRVDKIVEFQLASHDEIVQLFNFVFQDATTDEKGPDAHALSGPTLHQLSERFAASLPERELSPAEILSLLVQYKDSPTKMLANIEEWLSYTRQEKQKESTMSSSREEKILN